MPGPRDLPYMTTAITPIGVSSIPMSKYTCPQDSRFLESRRALYALALLAIGFGPYDHYPRDHSLIPRRGYGVSIAEKHLPTGFPIPRIPIRRYTDSWLPQWRFPPFRRADSWPHGGTFLLVGVSRFTIPKCVNTLSPGSPISR
jgi:hypothetical protein